MTSVPMRTGSSTLHRRPEDYRIFRPIVVLLEQAVGSSDVVLRAQ